jgi:hypothetical protein
MLGFLRLFLTWVGARLPEPIVWKLCMFGNYIHVGRWMREHQFSSNRRVKNREQVIEAMARPIADKQVLYLEFGVFQGSSMRQWAKWLTNRNSKLRGFDSFEGLPENWSGWSKKGQLSVGGRVPNIPDERVKFFKGWIEETLPSYKVEENEVLVVFIDTDLYSSTAYVLTTLKNHFKIGTIIYFDEFAVREHELQAFDNFLAESGMKFELIAADYGIMNVAFRRLA